MPESKGPGLSGSGQGKAEKRKSRKKLTTIVKFLFYIILFSAVVFAAPSFNIVFSKNDTSGGSPGIFSWEKIKSLVIGKDNKLRGETSNRINILLLGNGGEGHDGAYLTDTIIILSIVPSSKEAAMVSIPRDLYVPIGNFGWNKINHAMAFGMTGGESEGEKLMARTVNQVFDIPVHYYVRVDFEAFKKIVDIAGGIDVYVDNTIIDYRYPAAGKEDAENYNERFEGLVVEKGQRHMDGELALKYIRTRHALGAEGNDFARARRQQKVISALKKKFLSLEFLVQPQKILQIMGILQEHMDTNMEIGEIMSLAKIAKDIDASEITTKVLTTGKDGPLYSTTGPGGAYILRTDSGDFSEISQIVKDIFEKEQ